MASIRLDKISRLIQKELAIYFQQDGQSLAPGAMVSVSVVRISPDLSVARAYLSIFPSNNSEEILKEINKAKSQIRYWLAAKVKNQLRKTPDLSFFLDDSLDYIENIDNLLK